MYLHACASMPVPPCLACQVVGKLHHILRPFLLRRIKADVEKSLPKKKEIVLYADMTAQQREFQEHLIERTLEDFLNETVGNGV